MSVGRALDMYLFVNLKILRGLCCTVCALFVPNLS